MRTEATPICPKGHGFLQRRSVEQRIYTDGSSRMVANWACPTCGHRIVRSATEIDEAAQVCDFCSQPDPVKAYRCQDFGYILVALDANRLIKSRPAFSQGEWLACAKCAAFIDADDQPGLTRRSSDVLIAPDRFNADQRRTVVDSLRQMHEQFFAHRLPEKEVTHGSGD